VDAGGSKIDAALLDGEGTLLGTARVGNAGHDVVGNEEHLALALDAIGAACRDADLDPAVLPVADLGMYCLAGADYPTDDFRIEAWLGERGITARHHVRNDTFAVLRAGTDRAWGVAVVCGQGMNCVGVAPDGRTVRFPARGAVSGDWGGGLDVGGAALWHAVRAEDGRGEETLLASLVPAHFGLERPGEVTEGIYFDRIPEERLQELAPLVFRAAAESDAIAREIVDRQADEVVTMAAVAIRSLGMTELDSDVVLGGGIFRNELASFFERIDGGLARVAPQAQVSVLSAPPVIGAALLGLDLLGAPANAHRRTRTSLTHERLAAHTRALRKKV